MLRMKPDEQHHPVPIVIRGDIAVRCDGPDQFEKFDQLFRKMIAVPHSAITKEEAKWRRTPQKKQTPALFRSKRKEESR
jgi:hypothetical protein